MERWPYSTVKWTERTFLALMWGRSQLRQNQQSQLREAPGLIVFLFFCWFSFLFCSVSFLVESYIHRHVLQCCRFSLIVKSIFLELFLFSYYPGSGERHFQSTLPVNISLLPYEKQRQTPRINNEEALAFISHFIVFSMRKKWNRIRNCKNT